MVVAPGRMIDSFLSIPDAESLPLYRMALNIIKASLCVCGPGMLATRHHDHTAAAASAETLAAAGHAPELPRGSKPTRAWSDSDPKRLDSDHRSSRNGSVWTTERAETARFRRHAEPKRLSSDQRPSRNGTVWTTDRTETARFRPHAEPKSRSARRPQSHARSDSGPPAAPRQRHVRRHQVVRDRDPCAAVLRCAGRSFSCLPNHVATLTQQPLAPPAPRLCRPCAVGGRTGSSSSASLAQLKVRPDLPVRAQPSGQGRRAATAGG